MNGIQMLSFASFGSGMDCSRTSNPRSSSARFTDTYLQAADAQVSGASQSRAARRQVSEQQATAIRSPRLAEHGLARLASDQFARSMFPHPLPGTMTTRCLEEAGTAVESELMARRFERRRLRGGEGVEADCLAALLDSTRRSSHALLHCNRRLIG